MHFAKYTPTAKMPGFREKWQGEKTVASLPPAEETPPRSETFGNAR